MSDYPSRFASVAEAIAYAEANGQGTLTVQPDGFITNQNGEIMVYDSDGNLAPGGGPYEGLVAVPVPAPEPLPEPTPEPVLGEFGRFASQAEAIAYAEATIQGPMTIQADGTITNQNGQFMVYDSDGNLAPGGQYNSPDEPIAEPAPEPTPEPVPEPRPSLRLNLFLSQFLNPRPNLHSASSVDLVPKPRRSPMQRQLYKDRLRYSPMER